MDDLCDVDNYCANLLPEERQRRRDQHWAMVCDLLVSCWGDVQLVASAICDQGYVHADVVTALLTGSKDTA
jgi:hypothetical protein